MDWWFVIVRLLILIKIYTVLFLKLKDVKYKYFSDSDEKIHLLVKMHYFVYIIMFKNWQVSQRKIIYSTISSNLLFGKVSASKSWKSNIMTTFFCWFI